MEVKTTFWVKLSYIYILLPIIIFFIGYCNLITAILGCSVVLVSAYYLFKNAPALWKPQKKVEWILLATVFIISLIWVYSSGIGALVFQNSDHNCRNPIFELLVSQPWPVTAPDGQSILTYYIGFWFVPAVIGKLFNSVAIGYYAQIAWATIGVFFVFYYLFASLKKKNLMPIFIFIFFSGLDIIGYYIFRGIPTIMSHKEWWCPYQFSSMTTQLYWVFNQALPAWLLTLVLYHQKNNKNIVFLYTTLFISSTLPAIGIFPFVCYFLLKNGVDCGAILSKKHILNAIKSAITFENISSVLGIFFISYLYLSANISGGVSSVRIPNLWSVMFVYLPFVFLEAGIYMLAIFRKFKKEPLWYIALACFMVYPVIYIGTSNDFCMRATIPALIILVVMFLQALEDEEIRNKKLLYFIMLLAFFVGTLTPLSEISRTVIMTQHGYTKIESKLGFENFFGYVEGNKFLQYFGKQLPKN